MTERSKTMKLLVSDFDGTFYTGENPIKKNVETIHRWRSQNNLFMLSSGRSFESLMDKVEKYQIPIDFLATEDGSHLFDKTSTLLHETNMSLDIYSALTPLFHMDHYEEIQFGTTREYENAFPNNQPISSINFVLKDQNITPEFLAEWKRIKAIHPTYSFLVYGYGDTVFFCIKPQNVTKSTPIQFLESYIPNLSKEEIYTIGDGDNDKFMIEEYNGYQIGINPRLRKCSLKTYKNVRQLIHDIETQKVKKREF